MRLLDCLSLGLFGCLLVGPFLGGVRAEKCHSGWVYDHFNCYFFYPEEVSWEAAKTLCKRKGAHLGKIIHGIEPEALAGFLKQRGVKKNVWVEVDFIGGMVTTQSALVKNLDFLTWTNMSPKGQMLPYLCMVKKSS
ncbi:hypothetical protein lerEdw1_010648 [Lerista edwardsae]|nr:hypothetical protein lerEdw1_010648 [Lerista edwardsae]